MIYSQLIPRKKKLQRNMSVFDNRGNELPIIPSDVVEKSLILICDYYLYQAGEQANQHEKPLLSGFMDKSINFGDIFCYDDDEIAHNTIKTVIKEIKELTVKIEKINNKSRCFSYIERIYMLVGIYEDFYIPFVKLTNPIGINECFSLNYSIDTTLSQEKKESLIRKRFSVFGLDTITINLEIVENISNHIKILSPEGILFSHAGISGFQDENLKSKYGNLDKYLDNNMIYFNIPKSDSTKISEERLTIPEDPTKPIHMINVNLSVSKNFPIKPSLIRTLVLLMYISIFIPAFTVILFNQDLILSNILGIAVLTLTIIIAIGIYSIDKPFLELYATRQIFIITILFFIECVCLYFNY